MRTRMRCTGHSGRDGISNGRDAEPESRYLIMAFGDGPESRHCPCACFAFALLNVAGIGMGVSGISERVEHRLAIAGRFASPNGDA